MTKPLSLTRITPQRYDEMLGVLMPCLWLSFGFLVGEEWDHAECSVSGHVRARYAPFFNLHGRYYEARDPMTRTEFRAVTLSDLVRATTEADAKAKEVTT